jgi:hypothetical protein
LAVRVPLHYDNIPVLKSDGTCILFVEIKSAALVIHAVTLASAPNGNNPSGTMGLFRKTSCLLNRLPGAGAKRESMITLPSNTAADFDFDTIAHAITANVPDQ